MEQMQQIAEGLKESAQNYKKRNKSQEHGAGAEMDENLINSSQGSLEVLIEDLSDVEHRVEEFVEDPTEQSSKWDKPKLTEKSLKLLSDLNNMSDNLVSNAKKYASPQTQDRKQL